MKTNDLITRVDLLIDQGNKVVESAFQRKRTRDTNTYVDPGLLAGFRSASLSFLMMSYGESHPHYREFESSTKNQYCNNAKRGIEILKAIRVEIANGWIFSVKALVAAEVFADFVEMAEHLLESGYKDPAAVMCGSVLEEHLRQLCAKHGIDTHDEKKGKMIPRKADRLNSELAKENAYTKLDQKLVTAWLDLRNNAAHGHYTEYTQEQVKDMLNGVTNFLVRVSA